MGRFGLVAAFDFGEWFSVFRESGMAESVSDYILLVCVSLTIIAGLASIGRVFRMRVQKNHAGLLQGLVGRGEVSGSERELTIVYYMRIFFLFKLWTGSITYSIEQNNLLLHYEVRREKGDMIVALESVYSTSIIRQKRRPFWMVLCIICTLATIILAIMFSMFEILIGLILSLILFLLWFFQKRVVKFLILFGGAGEVSSGFLTYSTEVGEMVAKFLVGINAVSQIRREDLPRNFL